MAKKPHPKLANFGGKKAAPFKKGAANPKSKPKPKK